jgi:segregation and condensation protein B
MSDDPHQPTAPKAGETPAPETPVTEVPATETPTAEAPAAEATVADRTADEAPGIEAAATEASATEALVTEASPTEPSETEGPVAETPATDSPAAETPAPLREPDEDSLRLAEALVFASAEPVTPRGLARVLPDDIDADAVLAALRARYAGRGVELVDAGAGVMFRSALDLAPRLRKVIEAPRRLPRVAMETLAIVAYHQPMTRPEIEHIRGTALSQQTLDALLELNLIAPKGRRETPGRPTLWGTTPEFLAHFGLKDLRELPRREDLLLESAPPKSTPETLPADLQSPPEDTPE